MPAATGDIGSTLIGFALILVASKLGGELFERVHLPPVLGELLMGIVFGNLGLLGLGNMEFLRHQPLLDGIAEIGIVLLLFSVGLESTVSEMRRVGASSLLVAVVGVVVPSVFGFLIAAQFFPNESKYTHVFVGTILCATSVGITARVLQDLGKMRTNEAKVILGAAVIDDVLGLVVLATVTGMVSAANQGTVLQIGSVGWIAGKAVLFLAGALVLGRLMAGFVLQFAGRLRSRDVMLPGSLAFCFLLAFVASIAGLAPIVGAFTAGLILEEAELAHLAERERHSLPELLHPVLAILLPAFFFLMGFNVDLSLFGDVGILGFAVLLTIVAIVGKLACAAGVVTKGIDRATVAYGMIPRGEVGLVFTGVGLTLAIGGHPVVTPAVYSAVLLMVMATTIITPPLLKWRFGKLG